MKPQKKGLESRTNVLHLTTILAAVLMAVATRWLPGVLTVDTAGLLAAAILAAVAGRGAYLKADDRRKDAERKEKATVGEILAAKVVKFHQHGCKGGDCDCQQQLSRAGKVSP